MEVLDRAAVKDPVLESEQADLPSQGGAVIVRGRMLADTMLLYELHAKALSPKAGEDDEQAAVRAGAEIVAHTLARQVVTSDGRPLWTAEQWLIHGGRHPQEVMALHEVAQRLAGANPSQQPAETTAKN